MMLQVLVGVECLVVVPASWYCVAAALRHNRRPGEASRPSLRSDSLASTTVAVPGDAALSPSLQATVAWQKDLIAKLEQKTKDLSEQVVGLVLQQHVPPEVDVAQL